MSNMLFTPGCISLNVVALHLTAVSPLKISTGQQIILIASGVRAFLVDTAADL